MLAGITPLYRGGHGAYWALAEGRPELVGATIHVVDAGIDTGLALAQPRFETTPADSIATYPYLHLAAGLPSPIAAIGQALVGRQQPLSGMPDLPSRLRFHPTAWEYRWLRLPRGVR